MAVFLFLTDVRNNFAIIWYQTRESLYFESVTKFQFVKTNNENCKLDCLSYNNSRRIVCWVTSIDIFSRFISCHQLRKTYFFQIEIFSTLNAERSAKWHQINKFLFAKVLLKKVTNNFYAKVNPSIEWQIDACDTEFSRDAHKYYFFTNSRSHSFRRLMTTNRNFWRIFVFQFEFTRILNFISLWNIVLQTDE